MRRKKVEVMVRTVQSISIQTIFALGLAISAEALAQETPPPSDPPEQEPSQPRLPEEPKEPETLPTPPRQTDRRPMQETRAVPQAAQPAQVMQPVVVAKAEEEIVRAAEGDWGMFFRFGGLASLLASNNTRNVSSLLISQVGMKAVLSETMMVPFFFGTGVRNISEDQGNNSITDFGLDLGVGIEYHFRIWRRISPFFGASIGIGIQDPNGNDNLTIGIGLGPNMGVEYYIADRVSLTAQYLLVFQFESGEPPGANEKLTTIQLSTLSGGAMNLTYYF